MTNRAERTARVLGGHFTGDEFRTVFERTTEQSLAIVPPPARDLEPMIEPSVLLNLAVVADPNTMRYLVCFAPTGEVLAWLDFTTAHLSRGLAWSEVWRKVLATPWTTKGLMEAAERTRTNQEEGEHQ